jgi:hypothetical protein
MFLLAVLGTAAATSLAVIVHALHKAPEGYEDENGFHIIPPRPHYSGASVLPRRTTNQTLDLPVPVGGHLKS